MNIRKVYKSVKYDYLLSIRFMDFPRNTMDVFEWGSVYEHNTCRDDIW